MMIHISRNIYILTAVFLFGTCFSGCQHTVSKAKYLTPGEEISKSDLRTEADKHVKADTDIGKLLNAPETISINGKEIFVDTYIWRNYQPQISSSNTYTEGTSPKPLTAIIRLKTRDKVPLPVSIVPDYLWIINNKDIWETEFSDEVRPDKGPAVMEKIARRGPELSGVGTVDVVVKVNQNGNTYFIKASGQRISQTF